MPVTSETGRSRPRGFSLLELMVVLVILGLLAAALPLALGRTMAATRVRATAAALGGKRIARVTFYPDGSVTAAHIKVREDGYAVWIVIQPWSGRIRISNAGA
jgi:prepilin-type N-terminal cleavage/methylation domain-containing protein